MMLFVPTANKEVCGKALKLAIFFLLCSLGVFAYEWFRLESVNTQLHSSRVTKILWLLTAISRLYLQPFGLNGPHSELEILPCISQTCCQVYTSNVAEEVYYFFSESISQWCEWWLNNEWTQPRSLAHGEISELIFDTDSKEARMSSDCITDIGGGGLNGVQGCHNQNWTSRQQSDTTLAAQFCPVPLVKRMMVTVSQVNRLNSQQPCNGHAPLALREL
jgi:hypothetical protein